MVTNTKSVLVTICDHFGRTRKFACDYWWPICLWLLPPTSIMEIIFLDEIWRWILLWNLIFFTFHKNRLQGLIWGKLIKINNNQKLTIRVINVEAPRMIIVSMFRRMKLVSTSNDGLKSRRGKFQVPKSKIFGKKLKFDNLLLISSD